MILVFQATKIALEMLECQFVTSQPKISKKFTILGDCFPPYLRTFLSIYIFIDFLLCKHKKITENSSGSV